jgi:hypothetical protein
MTRRAPYRCGCCGGRYLLQERHNTIAGLITLAVAASSAFLLPRIGIPLSSASFLGLYMIVVVGSMWLFMKLQAV